MGDNDAIPIRLFLIFLSLSIVAFSYLKSDVTIVNAQQTFTSRTDTAAHQECVRFIFMATSPHRVGCEMRKLFT